MLGSSIFLMMFAHGLFIVYYIWYADGGESWMPILFMARMVQGAAETVFLILLILLAKGWTICCRAEISRARRYVREVAGTVYAMCWISTPVFYHFYADTASTLHMYQGRPSSNVLWQPSRRAPLGFLYSVNVTLNKYKSKVKFYKKFSTSEALGEWRFLSLPFTVAVSHAVTPWSRLIVVNALEFTATFVFPHRARSPGPTPTASSASPRRAPRHRVRARPCGGGGAVAEDGTRGAAASVGCPRARAETAAGRSGTRRSSGHVSRPVAWDKRSTLTRTTRGDGASARHAARRASSALEANTDGESDDEAYGGGRAAGWLRRFGPGRRSRPRA